MKYIFSIITIFIFLAWTCKPSSANNLNAKEKLANDSIKQRLQHLEKWYSVLKSNNDSVVSFAFYMSKDHFELKKKLSKYEAVPKAELLIDEMNDLMFSGGDEAHDFSNFANMGEVGHFFEERKKELGKLGVKYKWDAKKARYVLEQKK